MFDEDSLAQTINRLLLTLALIALAVGAAVGVGVTLLIQRLWG